MANPLQTFRQEINIICGIAGSGSGIVLGANGYIQIDTTQYTGATFYFEVVVSTLHAASTITLRRFGTTTDDASVSGAATGRVRSTSFAPPVLAQTVYGIFSADTTLQIKAARIVIIQTQEFIVNTETQIEIGDFESSTSTSAVALTNPKYWNYTAAQWSPTPTAYFEVTFKSGTSKSAATVALQVDNGAFASWAGVTGASLTTTGTVMTRVRSAAFTLTTGRNYRIVISTPSSKSAISVANAKIVLDSFTGTMSGVIGGTSGLNWYAGAVDYSNGNVYACVFGGDIYKQTGGSGSFTALGVNIAGSTTQNWAGIAVDSRNHNVYAVINGATNGDVYLQTAGSGSFNALGTGFTALDAIAVNSVTKDVFVDQEFVGIYKQTTGTGSFAQVLSSGSNSAGVAVDEGNGNVWVCFQDAGDIYLQTGGTGAFNAQGYTFRLYQSISINQSNHDVLVGVSGNPQFSLITAGSGPITLMTAAGFIAGQTLSVAVNSVNNTVYALDATGGIYQLPSAYSWVPQYLLLNTANVSTGLQGYSTLWSSAEWNDGANGLPVFEYAHDAANSANVSKITDTTTSTDVTGATVTGTNEQISAAFGMLSSGDTLDVNTTVATGITGASRILVLWKSNSFTFSKPLNIPQSINRASSF